jgi:uncharacterized membrane protein
MDNDCSEKHVRELIRDTLLLGVSVSAVLLTAGFALFLAGGFFLKYGTALLWAGLCLLLLTPPIRVIMLVYGYTRAGRRGFACAGAVVLALLAAGFFAG